MRSRRVTVYYCGFCSKRYFKKPSAEAHESICTMNPKRKCGMCNLIGNATTDMKEMKTIVLSYRDRRIDSSGDNHFWLSNELAKKLLEELRSATDNCPACILAACRQGGVFLTDFDFKKEMTEQMKEINANREMP